MKRQRTWTRRVAVVVSAVLAASAAVLLSACATAPSLRELLDATPVKQLSFYDFDPSVPLGERTGSPPAELLELYSRADGVTYRACEPDARERERLAAVYPLLPVRHRQVLRERLVAVYCVENFTGSGMADYVLGPGDEVYSLLILHPRVFEMTARELIQLRERTAFAADDSGVSIHIELSEEVSALAYIVLHEATHIVDYAERHTPYVEPGMRELLGRAERPTPFTDELWEDYRRLRTGVGFAHQEDLRFYGLGEEPALTLAEAPEVYTAISRTPLPSLYGAFSWAEDFAEFVSFYYLVHAWNADYRIALRRGGKEVAAWRPMDSPHAVRRAGLLDPSLLAAPPGTGPTRRTVPAPASGAGS